MELGVNIGVCKGRHNIPCVETWAFSEELSSEEFLNPEGLTKKAYDALKDVISPSCNIHLYITGLTVAVFATVNALQGIGVSRVTLMHFNKDLGEYFPQEIQINDIWI